MAKNNLKKETELTCYLAKHKHSFNKDCIDKVFECSKKDFNELLSYYMYIPPRSSEPKSTKELLERRVAMTLLKKNPPTVDLYLLVISIHSYGGTIKGKDSQERFNYLLFHFLGELTKHLLLVISIKILQKCNLCHYSSHLTLSQNMSLAC